MKKVLICLMILMTTILFSGCSLEDLGFEPSNGTGLNITREKYERINEGDSYTMVTIKLGGKCENYYSGDGEDWYTCIDDKDSFKRIVLKFVNGKLEHKSSSGLY